MKKHNMKIIQINGFRGILLSLFIVSCLIAGFIGFPAFLCMCLWNLMAERIYSVPNISFIGGLLLWGITFLSFIILNKRKLIISMSSAAPQEIPEDELKKILASMKTPDFTKTFDINNERQEQNNNSKEEINVNSKEN